MNQSQRIKQLERELIDLKIENHRKGYIHIPWNWKKCLLFLSFVGSIALSIGSFLVLLATWKQLNIGTLFADKSAYLGLYQLGIIPMLLFQYCMVALMAVCLAAMIKGGFDKIKSPNNAGLLFGLLFGLLVGLVVGLLFGLLFGLVVGLLFGLSEEFKEG